ncbi:MAG: NADH-quinone oxidoreductase subunit M [Bacteroidota bacterium]
MPILSILIWLPMIGMIIMAVGPKSKGQLYRWIALLVTLLQLGWTLGAVLPAFLEAKSGADAGGWMSHFYLQEAIPWIDFSLGSMGRLYIEYALGIDGLGFLLVLLTTIIMPIAVLSAWGVTRNVKGYFMLFMLLDLSMIGVFCALDFFLFYLFYEFMLLPMFFLIGLWGGPRREYASLKFFLYTLVGSVFMLLIMVGLLFSFQNPILSTPETPIYTLNFLHMFQGAPVEGSFFDLDSTLLGVNARLLAFGVLFVGFAIKLPMVPVHTWLPDAHVEAPTPISVILAGILLKVGGYGMLRICYGIFPDGALHFTWYIGLMGVISIVYGAFVAMAQKDLKRLVAYSSISHMGFVMLGIASLTAVGMSGATLQLFTHGIISAMLFLVVGVIYDRVHDRQIENFRGLWQLMPAYAVFTLIGFFASLGLPGFAAFVSELLVFMGAFQAAQLGSLPYWMAIVSTLGIVLGATYYLRTYRQMFFGIFNRNQTSDWLPKLTDLTPREYLLLTPLAILTVWLGVFPGPLLDLFEADMADFGQWVRYMGEEMMAGH